MPVLDRQVGLRGPKFYRDADGKVHFVLHLDGSTRIGPREVAPEDPEVYRDAWDAFNAEEVGRGGEPLRPMVTFDGDERPEPLKAKGSKAPA